MGISRDHWHKRRATGGKRKPLHKKRKYELGRPAANTKVCQSHSLCMHFLLDFCSWAQNEFIWCVVAVAISSTVRCVSRLAILRGDRKVSAWMSSARAHVLGVARKTRIIDVVYNSSNNELVRTKTLVKNAIVVIDAAPFRQWYEAHYALALARKKGAKLVCCLHSAHFHSHLCV